MSDSAWLVYRWQTSRDFLIHSILPGATAIEAAVEDSAEAVCAALPPNPSSFLFHLNCTHTARFPASRIQLIKTLTEHGIAVLNAGVVDISKKTIQQRCSRLGLNCTLASPEGDDDEGIIVKTDLNFGGDSEWALAEEERAFLGVGPGSDIIWKPDHYRILSRKDIERSWWADRRLICERFVSNRDNVWYRAFLFAGQLAVCELWSPDSIKKVGESTVLRVWRFTIRDGLATQEFDDMYPELLVRHLLAFIHDSSLDFGAVDVVRDDHGQPYIIDVNSTPAYNHPIPGVVEHLRQSLCLSSQA